jgi:hypothetical protein
MRAFESFSEIKNDISNSPKGQQKSTKETDLCVCAVAERLEATGRILGLTAHRFSRLSPTLASRDVADKERCDEEEKLTSGVAMRLTALTPTLKARAAEFQSNHSAHFNIPANAMQGGTSPI